MSDARIIIQVPFETFEDAMHIHKLLFTMLRRQGSVNYCDLKYLIDTSYKKDLLMFYPGCEEVEWSSLWDAKVELDQSTNNWILKMPEIIINKEEIKAFR